MGALLARLEGPVALATILCRLPGLKLASGQPPWGETMSVRGLKTLPVAFTPAV